MFFWDGVHLFQPIDTTSSTRTRTRTHTHIHTHIFKDSNLSSSFFAFSYIDAAQTTYNHVFIMGIQGLLPLVKSIEKPVNLKDYAGMTLAIDGYVWLHKGAFACAQEICLGQPTDK